PAGRTRRAARRRGAHAFQPGVSSIDRDRRLSKRDVELMLTTYDVDPVAALERALRRLTDRPDFGFDELLDLLATDGSLSPDRHRGLTARDVDALDALASELNETRRLPS
ncbi:MAG: hypothetical protein JWN99_1, partial [Ilumatobacteraceae bacterium]|nr:hypothetical protein [Ilumatobacteraceae bacterium]